MVVLSMVRFNLFLETRMKILAILVLVSIAAVFAMVIPTVAYADPPHCDRTGYPLCYDLGHAAGQAAGSGPCPTGHSRNYCVGWKDGINGVNGNDIDCENPNQPKGIVAGCPNDK
jgi:hypothetical protein